MSFSKHMGDVQTTCLIAVHCFGILVLGWVSKFGGFGLQSIYMGCVLFHLIILK